MTSPDFGGYVPTNRSFVAYVSYLTHWINALLVAYFLLVTYAMVVQTNDHNGDNLPHHWHESPNDPGNPRSSKRGGGNALFGIIKVIHSTCLPGTLLITIFFWAAATYTKVPPTAMILASVINMHGVSILLIFADMALSKVPYNPRKNLPSYGCSMLIYFIFCVTYFTLGGINEFGSRYAHSALGFVGNPRMAGITAAAVAIIVVPLTSAMCVLFRKVRDAAAGGCQSDIAKASFVANLQISGPCHVLL